MPVAKTSPRSGTSWMITYGDVVTLLLTFFVLVFVMLNEAESNIYRMINALLSEVSGISESKFSAPGYGEYRPLTTNETEEGRSLT